MFYDVRLLSVVNGRFGVVWFLGCHNRRSLTRKQIESVQVRQTCKEIQELLPISNHHASLHTLMTLQLGVVVCLELQIDFLIRDVDVTIRRAKDMSVIDLPSISEISQVLKDIDRVDEAQKRAPKRPFTCLAKLITLPNEDDINFTALEIFDPGFGQTEAIAGGNDALSLLSGDIFSDLPDDLRTMENIEDIFPETPGAPGRRKHENDPAIDNVTRVEVEESDDQPSKKPCPVLPNFEEEEMQEPENLMDLVANVSVDSGHPTSGIPPFIEEGEPMEIEPVDVTERLDLDEPLPVERRNSSPSSINQEDADNQIINAAPVARDDPPARRKARKRVKIDKVHRIPRDQMQRNLENVEVDRAHLFVRSNPEALSGANFLRTAGRNFFVDHFKNGFIVGIDDIQPALDENAGGQDEKEAIRDINRGENQGDVADFIDNTHHFDPQSPGGDSRARSETNGDMNFDAEPQLIHEDILVHNPLQDISVDQSGPPVLEPTMLSGEILPSVHSPLQEEPDESLKTVPISQSFVAERIMEAIDDSNYEVCFQDVIADSCFSRSQASSFFMGLLTLVAQGKIEAHQECFYGDIKISRR